jgi:hypothetical protein
MRAPFYKSARVVQTAFIGFIGFRRHSQMMSQSKVHLKQSLEGIDEFVSFYSIVCLR